MTKHFLKTLIVFSIIILFDLLGIYLINYFDKSEKEEITPNDANFLK